MPHLLPWLLVLLLVAPVVAADEAEPLAVAVDTARVEPVAEVARVLGRLVPLQRGDVSTRVAGLIAEVAVNVGDRVRRGDVIARIDAGHLRRLRDLAQAELAEAEAARADAAAEGAIAEAAIATAKARVGSARQELDRMEKLVDSAAFSQARYDDLKQEIVVAESVVAEAAARRDQAKTALGRAEAAIVRARANLALADDDLADTVIRAPYEGVVVLREAEVGAYADNGDALVTLLNDRALEIEAEVPAERIAAVVPGLVVAVTLAPGVEGEATVRAVVADEDPMTRTRPVRLVLAAPTGMSLAAGQTVEVPLPVGPPREALTVAKDAILRDSTTAWVFVVVEGKAEKRPVRLGAAVGDRFEVLEGLAAGDPVIVRGNERLAPGQPVSF